MKFWWKPLPPPTSLLFFHLLEIASFITGHRGERPHIAGLASLAAARPTQTWMQEAFPLHPGKEKDEWRGGSDDRFIFPILNFVVAAAWVPPTVTDNCPVLALTRCCTPSPWPQGTWCGFSQKRLQVLTAQGCRPELCPGSENESHVLWGSHPGNLRLSYLRHLKSTNSLLSIRTIWKIAFWS